MKKLKYYPISSGHVLAAWNILYLTSRYKEISAKNAVNISVHSGKLGGTLPAKQGLKICIDYELIVIKDNVLSLSDLSNMHIIPHCKEEDPNIEVFRAILYHLISFHNFQWIIFYDPDPDIFKQYLYEQDPEWTHLLEDAKLFDFNDEPVMLWWNKVLSKYESFKDNQKKAIGDIGEKLTYNYEVKRIELDGYVPSKSYVKWASRISDRFGYDVLSIRGKYFHQGFDQKDKIQIEVKSSDSSNHEMFRFFISKPEWKTAQDNLRSYFFFCWLGIDIERESALDGPFIIPATVLIDHIPKDVSPFCDWSECRCVMNISKFKVLPSDLQE
jgi:hypothetical protein